MLFKIIISQGVYSKSVTDPPHTHTFDPARYWWTHKCAAVLWIIIIVRHVFGSTKGKTVQYYYVCNAL